ncbi:MAG TPA: LLM class flavin-dependent oxidoreductase [Chloroflexia bacterium]|nr:LLM class flavin-dependent oxidoreductase [Chloroflexia bacterium]
MNDNDDVTAARPERALRERVGLSIHAIAGVDAPTLVDLIVQAEEAGVKQVWATQGGASTDLLTAYAAAFQRTGEIRLGTSIVPIYPRHPLALAQQAATAAGLGPGRLRLGVGTSHRPSIEGVYGMKMEEPLEYLKEYVQVLRAALWDGSIDHKGRFFTAKVRMNHPQPVPVLMATLGEKAFRLAGEISDGAISWNVPARHLLNVALPALREGAKSAGRTAPPLVAHVPVVLSEDAAVARAAAKKALSVYARLPFYYNMWAAAGYPLEAEDSVSDDLVDNLVVIGDEAAVAARLHELLDLGLDELLLNGLPAGDAVTERTRLIRLIGDL